MALTRPEKTPGDPQESKSGSLAWLWILMGLAVLAFIIWWWLWPKSQTVPEDLAIIPSDTTITETAAQQPPEAGMVPASISAVRQNPDEWTGKLLSGTFNVVDVPSDRGFWIEQDGERMFAVLVDQPAEVPIDIKVGQRLLMSGMVRDASHLPQLEGEDLAETTRNIVEEQPVYLVVDEDQIAEAAARETGTQPPATTQ